MGSIPGCVLLKILKMVPEATLLGTQLYKTRSRGYKTYFMLNSAELEISNPHKY